MWQYLQKITFLGVKHADASQKYYILLVNYLLLFLLFVAFFEVILHAFSANIWITLSYAFFFCMVCLAVWWQSKGFFSRVKYVLCILPPVMVIAIGSLLKHTKFLDEVQIFYILLGLSVLPLLLFNGKKERLGLLVCLAFNLTIILTYDNLWGLPTVAYVNPSISQNAYFAFKIKQLLLFSVIAGGFYLKISINNYYEEKLVNANLELKQSAAKEKELSELLQTQNEELKASREELEAQNEELHQSQTEIIQLNDRISAYTHTLMALAKNEHVQKGNLDKALLQICSTIANVAGIDRVSIWLLDKRKAQIQCALLYEKQLDNYSKDFILKASDYPTYFSALQTQEMIAANDATTHPFTAEFKDTYLMPHRIKSMLDAPFVIHGHDIGVVCCEMQEKLTHWQPEDIFLVRSVADIVAIAFESAERKNIENKIRLQREEILSKNHELQQKQQLVNKINESLESKIKERTEILEKKNTQLQEYTYVNSHLLRGPLCRILGIIYLLENNLLNNEMDYLKELKTSAAELDDLIKKISRNLEGEHQFNLEELLSNHTWSKN